MLREVINDEEKANSKTTSSSENHDTPAVLKSLGTDDVRDSPTKEKAGTEGKTVRIRPCTDATCDEIVRRSKSVEKPIRKRHRSSTVNRSVENRSNVRIRYVPCPYLRKRESVSKDKEEDTLSSQKPTRDTESTVNEHPVVGPKVNTPSLTKESDKNYELPFLQCPACGWETENYNQFDRNAENPLQNFYPCSSYIRDPSKNYTLCTGCDQVTRDENLDPNAKKYTNNSGDFEILQDPTKQVSHLDRVVETVSIRSPVEPVAEPKKVVDVGVQYEEQTEKLSKNGVSVNVPVQTQVLKFDPVTANKLQGGIIEACLKIILSGSRGNLKANGTSPVSQNTREVQYVRPESKTKETQSPPKNITPRTRSNEVATNTVNYAEAGVQNTVCISDGTTRCVSIQTLSQTDEKGKRKGESTVQRTASKEVTVNMVDKATKGIQSTVCVSRANLFRSRSSDRTEVGTITSMHQFHSVACATMERSSSVQSISDGRNVPVTRAKSHGSINHCVRRVDFRSVERETQEYEAPCRTDTCPRNMMNFIKNDPAIALVLQKLLHSILFSGSEQSAHSAESSSSDLQTDNDHTCRLKGKCTIDATEMMNKIKEYTIRTLGSDVNDFSKSEAKEFHQKFDASTSPQEVEEKPASTKTESSVLYASTLTMTDGNDLKSSLQTAVAKPDKTQQLFENDTELMEKKNEKLSTVDKERLSSIDKEVYTDDSMLQLLRRDVQTQSSSQLLKDPACPDKCEQTVQNRISVGTQKRDPILVRVIKCSENQAIVRSDKQTLTARIDADVTEKPIGKRVETCGRSTCIPYNINRKLNETNLESAFRKKRENIMDNAYRKRSVMYSNYICDKNCKGKANSDWTDVIICPNNQNSKIPLGIGSRK